MPLALADLGLVQESTGDCNAAVGTIQRFLDNHAERFWTALGDMLAGANFPDQ